MNNGKREHRPHHEIQITKNMDAAGVGNEGIFEDMVSRKVVAKLTGLISMETGIHLCGSRLRR